MNREGSLTSVTTTIPGLAGALATTWQLDADGGEGHCVPGRTLPPWTGRSGT